MRYGFQTRERVGKYFEGCLVVIGGGLILFDLLSPRDGAMFFGFLILFIWTFILGLRWGMLLQEAERKYVKSCREENELKPDVRYIIKCTLLASLPIYLGFAFPILLLPYGGFYAIAFFIPLILASTLRLNIFYQRWAALEVKPSFYWWMQIGICFAMIVFSFVIFFLGGGEIK